MCQTVDRHSALDLRDSAWAIWPHGLDRHNVWKRSLGVLAPVIATFVFLASFAIHYNSMRVGSRWISAIPAGSGAHEFLLRVLWSLCSSVLVAVVLASVALSVWTIAQNVPRRLALWFAIA